MSRDLRRVWNEERRYLPNNAQVVKPSPQPPPASLLPPSLLHTLQPTLDSLTTLVQLSATVVRPWRWRWGKRVPPPPSVARVTLRNNFVALSGVVVLWYLGAWDLLWRIVKTALGSGAEMILKRLLLFSLIANIVESAYTLSYPPPLPEPMADTVPLYKGSSVSPAHRKLIERSLQDLPPPTSSPFSSPSKLSPSSSHSLSRSRSFSPSQSLNASLSRSSTVLLNSSHLSSSFLSSSTSSLGSTLRSVRDEASKDPLNIDNPESPLRAFEGRRGSPKAGRALGAGDLERMRRERW